MFQYRRLQLVMNFLVCAAAFALMPGVVNAIVVGQAKGVQKSTLLSPKQLIGKTIEECEQILGPAKYVEGFDPQKPTGVMSQERYYKFPGFTRVKLLLRVEMKNGSLLPVKDRRLDPAIQNVIYTIPKAKVKTWQEALKMVGLNPADFTVEDGSNGRKFLASTDAKYTATWFPAGWKSEKTAKADTENHSLFVGLREI
ncbi:MAG: hypothetical protein V4671_31185 [Armatimonadota bacterium]